MVLRFAYRTRMSPGVEDNQKRTAQAKDTTEMWATQVTFPLPFLPSLPSAEGLT